MSGKNFYFIFVALSALFLFVYQVDRFSLTNKEEVFFVESAREMITHNNFLVPEFNGKQLLDKAPLLFWQNIISFKVFGLVDISTKVIAVSSCLGILLFSFLLGNINGYGIVSSLITMSSLGIILASKNSISQIFASFIISGVLSCFYLGYHARLVTKKQFAFNKKTSSIWFILSFVFAALLALIDGPLILVSSVILIVVFLWFEKDTEAFFRETWREMLIGLGVFLIIVLPWYLFMFAKFRGVFIDSFFVEKNINIIKEIFFSNHKIHWFDLILDSLFGFLPWTFFLIQSFYASYLSNETLSKTREERANTQMRFLLFWSIITFTWGIFSCHYYEAFFYSLILPLSLITARWFAFKFENKKQNNRNADAVLSLFIFIGVTLIATYLALTQYREALGKINHSGFLMPIVLLAFIVISANLIALTAINNRAKVAFAFIFGSTILAYLVMINMILIPVNKYHDDGLKAILSRVNKKSEIVSVGFYNPKFSFYAGREVKRIKNKNLASYISQAQADPKRNFIITKKKYLNKFKNYYLRKYQTIYMPLTEIQSGKKYIVLEVV